MKKLILACSTAFLICVPATSEDVKLLTQEQIDQILEQAEKNGDLSQSDPKARMVIITPQFDMFSDISVHCNDAEKFGDGPTIIPLDESGVPDADQLPEHCTFVHKLVAREKLPEPPQLVLNTLPDRHMEEKRKEHSKADTVDEHTSAE